MNKTSIPAKELRHILMGFRKIVPRRESEFRRVQVTFGPGVRLMATDGTATLTYAIDTKSSITGTYQVSFDDLSDFAKGLPARSEVVMERHEKHLSFLAEDRVFHTLPAKDATPFPPPPRLVGKLHPVTPQDREAILRAMTCTSKDDTRYILKGVLVEEGRVVATDGRTLYHEILHDLPVENPFIMPASPLIKWQGLGAEWQLKITSGKKVPVMIEVRSGPWSLITPAIQGNFPNWRQVLPEERKLSSHIRLGDKDIAILRTLTNDSIGLVARDGIVSFLQLSEDGKQWQSYRAPGSLAKGPDAFIFLNREFLHRALDAGLGELLVGKELDPCLFKGRGHMVVMPLRVTGPPLPGDKPKNNNPIESRPERTQAPKTMNGKTPPKTTPLRWKPSKRVSVLSKANSARASGTLIPPSVNFVTCRPINGQPRRTSKPFAELFRVSRRSPSPTRNHEHDPRAGGRTPLNVSSSACFILNPIQTKLMNNLIEPETKTEPIEERPPGLLLHCGAELVTRDALFKVPTPANTETWYPMSHRHLLTEAEDQLSSGGFILGRQAHALSHDGARYFGVLELQLPGHQHADYRWVVGLRNSHDKTFPAAMVAGTQVLVCDNMAFTGQVKLSRKHTRFAERDLRHLTSRAVGKLGDRFIKLDERIDAYKQKRITDNKAHDLIVRALDCRAITSTQVPKVLSEWRKPTHREFQRRNVWSLFNAVTETHKELNPHIAAHRSEALHGLCDTTVGLIS